MLTKKRVLLFTDWYEPGFKAGGPIRSCKNLLNTLHEAFSFYILTSDRDLGDKQPYDGIKRDKWISLGNDQHILYASPGTLDANFLKKIIIDIQPSVVYLNSLFSQDFTLKPLWTLKKMNFSGRIVLAPRGMLKTSALNQKRWKKILFLKAVSLTGVANSVIFHATDEQEKLDILKHIGRNSNVILAPNIPNSCATRKHRKKIAGELSVVYVSRIHPIKNLLYALQVLGTIKSGCRVRFDIYGAADDENYFRKCFHAARLLEKRVEVQFMGPLEHAEIFNTLQQHHLFFLPTLGENFGHAIFEALSAGCPVLISNATPWKDVEKNGAGWTLPLNDPQQYASVIEKICNMTGEEFSIISGKAYDYAEKYVSQTDYKRSYLELFGSA